VVPHDEPARQRAQEQEVRSHLVQEELGAGYG